MCKKKMATSAELLCRYTPPAFRQVCVEPANDSVVNHDWSQRTTCSVHGCRADPGDKASFVSYVTRLRMSCSSQRLW